MYNVSSVFYGGYYRYVSVYFPAEAPPFELTLKCSVSMRLASVYDLPLSRWKAFERILPTRIQTLNPTTGIYFVELHKIHIPRIICIEVSVGRLRRRNRTE